MDLLLAWILLLGAFLGFLVTGLLFRRGRPSESRPIPAFDLLPPELGKSAESGAPFLFALGSGGIGGERTLTSVAALETLDGLTDAAVAYGTPPVVVVGDPTLMVLAEDALRRAWARRGTPERHNPAQVRFIGTQPAVYAAGVADLLSHEPIHGNILIGAFDEEASLVASAAEGRRRFQSAAVDRLSSAGALYGADATLATGEELYAGPALVTGIPRFLSSLWVQDFLRFVVLALLLLFILGVL
ncbi:MAG: hypothetical protein D6793_02515 [Thermoflexia bacterium]|nr:MAG: hypothetical protein D6793_02515 [Thermoflexia bacterium]